MRTRSRSRSDVARDTHAEVRRANGVDRRGLPRWETRDQPTRAARAWRSTIHACCKSPVSNCEPTDGDARVRNAALPRSIRDDSARCRGSIARVAEERRVWTTHHFHRRVRASRTTRNATARLFLATTESHECDDRHSSARDSIYRSEHRSTTSIQRVPATCVLEATQATRIHSRAAACSINTGSRGSNDPTCHSTRLRDQTRGWFAVFASSLVARKPT